MASANAASPATDATRVRMVHLRYDMSTRKSALGRRRLSCCFPEPHHHCGGRHPGPTLDMSATDGSTATFVPIARMGVSLSASSGPSDAGPTLARMTLGIVVFGAAFLVGLGLGTYTRRPLSTAFLVLGSFTALLVLSATGEVLGAAAVLTIVVLLGLVAETMRETVGLLVGR